MERIGNIGVESLAPTGLLGDVEPLNDYIHNLAAKFLNLADVVSPRVNSLFEPYQEGAWAISEDSPNLEAKEGESSTNDEGLDHHQFPKSFHSRFAAFQQPDKGKNQSPNMQQNQSSKLISSPMSQSLQLSTPASGSDEIRPKKESFMIIKELVAPSVNQVSDNLEDLTNLSLNTPNNKTDSEFSEKTAYGKDLPGLRPITQNTKIKPKVSTGSEVISQPPHAPDSSKSKPLLFDEPLMKESVNTINVSINRIEVRVKPPETKKIRNRTDLPAMGLDEYLRKRVEGGN